MTLALTLAAAVIVGITLGMLGGGGSILTVPLLIYLAGIPPKDAITMSLFVVGVTSIIGLIPHARAGRVRWRAGLLFGAAGMAGAYVGGRLAAHIPGGFLLVAFAIMMATTAVAMLRHRASSISNTPVTARRPTLPIIVQGTTVGLVTGLVGAGGGFVVVPALTLFAGLAMPTAVGTSLLVIALNSFAGLAGHMNTAHLDWSLTLAVTASSVAGSLVGSRLTGRIAPARLRRVFGWFIIAMAAFMLAEQAPAAARHAVFATPLGCAASSALATLLVTATVTTLWCRHRYAPTGRSVSQPTDGLA
jgi:uncharacterized protein